MPREQLLGDAHLGRLDVVRVGDDPAPEDVARAGNRGQPRGNQPARARLSRCDGQPELPRRVEHQRLDRTLVLGEQVLAQPLAQRRCEPVGALARVLLGDQVDVDLELAGADRRGQAIRLSPRLGQRPCHRRLARAVEAERPPVRHSRTREHCAHRSGLERRRPEPLQLGRRAREHNDRRPVPPEHEARRGSGDADHERAGRQRRLLAHAFGEVAVGPLQTLGDPPGEPLDLRLELRVDGQLEAGGPREHLHRAVVVSRPEHAEVCLEPFPQRRLQLRGAVADDRDARRLDPQAQQLRSQERPVSIRALAPDELAARHDDDPARARQPVFGARLTPCRVTCTATVRPPPGIVTACPFTDARTLPGLPKSIQSRRATKR